MKFARVLSLVLALLMIVSVLASCFGDSSKETSSGKKPKPNNSSQSSEVENFDSSSDFDDGSSTVTPGDEQEQPEEEDPNDYDPEEEESLFLDKDANFEYYYENDVYAYGITTDAEEVFAFKDGENEYKDVLRGAGRVNICDVTGLDLLTSGGVAKYDRTLNNNALALVVSYNYATVDFGSSPQLQATYTFYDDYVDVSYRLSYSSKSYTISKSKSGFRRTLMCNYESVNKEVADKWNYPVDSDFAYKTVRAYMSKLQFDDTHSLYTFTYGDIPEYYQGVYFEESYPPVDIPLFIEDGSGVDYTVRYAMVFSRPEKNKNEDYEAFFLSDGADFAAGVAPLEPEADDTSLFRRDKVELNLNVTNLTDEDIYITARYDVRDYYGNIVDSGIYTDSTVFGKLDANRKITIDAKKTGYGMYFVNFKVMTKYYVFNEMYPLILLDDYDYPNRASTPFGIAQAITNGIRQETNYGILMKIGSGYIRSGFTDYSTKEAIAESKDYLTKLKQAGLNVMCISGGQWGIGYTNAESYRLYNTFKDYFDYLLNGNEKNMELNSQGAKPPQSEVDRVWNEYYEEIYAPSAQICKEFGWTMVYAGMSAAWRNWYDAIYKAGLWKRNDVFNVHTYSVNNRNPDHPDDYGAMWGAEAGLIRTRDVLEDYGNKRWVVNEIGYSTEFGTNFVGPRTKSDYDTRCFILCVAYGAEAVETYCLYDYSNGGWGRRLSDMEYGFGSFYHSDYFERVLPKPSAMAFITMVRCLDGYKSCVESSKYSNGVKQNQNGRGKLRVFDVNTSEFGHVFVAWSNIYYQSNVNGSTRDPEALWSPNNFVETEDLVMTATTDKVKVVSIGGKVTTYTPDADGKVTIPVTGSPVYIYGVK